MAVRAFLLVTAAVMVAIGMCLSSVDGLNGPSARPPVSVGPYVFVAAPPSLLKECRRVANVVAYAVPCPLLIIEGLSPTPQPNVPGLNGCSPWQIVGLSRCPGVTSWRHWVVGNSQVESDFPTPEHLVIQASPSPQPDYAKAIDGPGWYRGATVDALGGLTTTRWRVEEVFVPPDTNAGSAFAGHYALVWTVGRHTYAVGFHDVYGRRITEELDRTLVDHLVLVPPVRTPFN